VKEVAQKKIAQLGHRETGGAAIFQRKVDMSLESAEFPGQTPSFLEAR
jgi:hypothetical protein